MSLKEQVHQLLSKYDAGENLSNAEKKELARFLEEEKYAEYVNAYYYSRWNEEHSKNFDSQKVLNSLFTSISSEGENSTVDLSVSTFEKKKINFVGQFLKYAAILIIGIIISSIYHTQLKNIKIKSAERYSTVEVEYGSKSKIMLPDGTSVWLNSGSKITYPEKFNAKSRNVTLVGEAFFDVVRNESRPFFVNTRDINIKVLGTKFNVKSYDDENKVETTLISGKVELKRKNSDDSKFIRLEPNQKAVFYRTENTVEITSAGDEEETAKSAPKKETIEVGAVEETQLITSWKDGKLKFDAELFGELAQKMERWFDVKMIFENEAARSIRYSGAFEEESIEQAMRALQLSYPIRYEIKKNEVRIY